MVMNLNSEDCEFLFKIFTATIQNRTRHRQSKRRTKLPHNFGFSGFTGASQACAPASFTFRLKTFVPQVA